MCYIQIYKSWRKRRRTFLRMVGECRAKCNPRNKPWFIHVCSTSLLKTLWEKEKLLIMRNFTFFQQCFLPIWRTFYHFHQIWNCHLRSLWVWKSLNFVVWERVNLLLVFIVVDVQIERIVYLIEHNRAASREFFRLAIRHINIKDTGNVFFGLWTFCCLQFYWLW